MGTVKEVESARLGCQGDMGRRGKVMLRRAVTADMHGALSCVPGAALSTQHRLSHLSLTTGVVPVNTLSSR